MDTSQFRPLSASMKMADLVNLDFTLVGVLSRMGIPFGFGDATVEEVCRRQGVHTGSFLLICSVYAFDGYRPAKEALDKADLHDIVRYLHLSHDYYIHVALKELSLALDSLMEPCGVRERKVLDTFFEGYKEELLKHFAYEEETVFPHVEAVLGGNPDGFTIGEYEDNHSNIQEKIDDLKNLVMKYLPPQCDQQQIFRALFYVFTLERDLQRHTALEDDVLVTLVNRLESHE